MSQYPSLYSTAFLQACGSAGRILAQTKALEHLAKELTDATPEDKVIVSLPSYPQNDRFRFRVIDSLARHKPINGGVIYAVVTAWKDYEWLNKETRWLIGGDYTATIDDTSHNRLEQVIHHAQTDHLIHAIQQSNKFIDEHPQLLISTIPFDADRVDHLAQALPDQFPCAIAAVGDRAIWCSKPENVKHFGGRIDLAAVDAVGLYRFLNGSMQHSDRTIAWNLRTDSWLYSEFLLKARYNPDAALIQLLNVGASETKAINQVCCQLLPLLQDGAVVMKAAQVNGDEVDAVLHSFHHYVQQSMVDLEQNWLSGLDEV